MNGIYIFVIFYLTPLLLEHLFKTCSNRFETENFALELNNWFFFVLCFSGGLWRRKGKQLRPLHEQSKLKLKVIEQFLYRIILLAGGAEDEGIDAGGCC